MDDHKRVAALILELQQMMQLLYNRCSVFPLQLPSLMLNNFYGMDEEGKVETKGLTSAFIG